MSLSSGSNVDHPSAEVPMHSAGKKTVRFSAMSELRHVSYPTAEEKQERWYDLEDVRKSQIILARDILRCSRMLISKSERGIGITEEERDQCVGIEHLLSRDTKQKMLGYIAMKKRHLYAVLIEQARQKHFQINSVEELERVATMSSHSARQRSHAIACLLMPALS
eukprot:CCRYP_004243-RA/>CCRYP_004243-RA protein AED:0.01 eAED:0.01 QI:175/1/1/1/0/0/2/170/165